MRMAVSGSLLIAILAATLAGCGSGPESPRSKRIYSILQSEELETRQHDIKQAYVYKKNAFGTEYNTIAFPLRNARGEYIVFLANPKDADPPYSVPSSGDMQFVLDEATLNEIVAKKYITGSLQGHLRRYIAR
jgi:hypothetical protein